MYLLSQIPESAPKSNKTLQRYCIKRSKYWALTTLFLEPNNSFDTDPVQKTMNADTGTPRLWNKEKFVCSALQVVLCNMYIGLGFNASDIRHSNRHEIVSPQMFVFAF